MVISVCVDVSFLRSTLTGVGHYTLEVVKALEKLRPEAMPPAEEEARITLDAFDGFRPRPLRDFLDRMERRENRNAAFAANRRERHFGVRARAIVNHYGGAAVRRYHRVRSRSRYDVFHATNFFPPVPFGSAVVPVIHDLSVMRHPEYHPPERVRWFDRHIGSILSAPCILTTSEFSAREISTLLGIAPERIRVAYPGVDRRFFEPETEADDAVLARFGVERFRYALSVSTLEPRKNLRTLVDAYGRLPAGVRANLPLVLVGQEGWGELDWPKGTDELVRAGQIRFTGYVDDIVLRTLYRGAAGFFYPSLYEGYGMPVTEALACGAPVIVAGGGATEEAAVGMGLLVDPLDTEAWTEALIRADQDMQSNDPAARHMRRVAAAVRTWEVTARATRNAYIEAAAAK
ncbi:glycosyltransferase family 4 protein [Chelatococcus sp. GCM10030263]|uniref:glycosyltransferase family 4 protein n=1 Tax=Chelatococcus sp. GCM10030263 TaxID=3273387 RepID=UPI003622CEF6